MKLRKLSDINKTILFVGSILLTGILFGIVTGFLISDNEDGNTLRDDFSNNMEYSSKGNNSNSKESEPVSTNIFTVEIVNKYHDSILYDLDDSTIGGGTITYGLANKPAETKFITYQVDITNKSSNSMQSFDLLPSDNIKLRTISGNTYSSLDESYSTHSSGQIQKTCENHPFSGNSAWCQRVLHPNVPFRSEIHFLIPQEDSPEKLIFEEGYHDPKPRLILDL